MFKQLIQQKFSYRAMRGLHICIVFGFTILLQELFHYPQAGWTGFAVMMIYAGFDNGTTLFRAHHRFWGMVLGLFSGYLLWFLGHLDYRTLILLIPLTIFFAYFLVGRAYSIPTVFTVNTAVIGTGYFASHSQSSITFFIIDYIVCTIIAFAICLGFEYFVFSRYGLMKRFIYDTQAHVVKDLEKLVKLLNHGKISRSQWFRSCIELNRSLTEVNQLIKNSSFEYSSKKVVGEEFNQFVELTNKIFINIKALYSAYHTKRYLKYDYQQLYKQVVNDLATLERSLNEVRALKIQSGVIFDAHN